MLSFDILTLGNIVRPLLAAFLLIGALLKADLGLESDPPLVIVSSIDGPVTGLAVCFTVSEDMEARSIAMACASARGGNAYLFSLHRERKGKPGELLAQSSGIVPSGSGWIQGQIDGSPLLKGERVCITLSRDPRRGGDHAVDSHSQGKDPEGGLNVMSRGIDKSAKASAEARKALKLQGANWIPSDTEPLWALLGRGKKIVGHAWSESLSLPIHGGGTRDDISDDLWQAQVFHFPCGHKPRGVKARVRRIGDPKEPLILAVLKHEYGGHGVRPLFEFTFSEAAALGSDWRWIEAELPADTGSFPPDCHYFALKTRSGNAEGKGCKDCYEISGARVLKGLELVQELSWYGGAHKDRASSSLNAKHWKDDFEADLNAVVLGPPCPEESQGQSPRLIPTPRRGLAW